MLRHAAAIASSRDPLNRTSVALLINATARTCAGYTFEIDRAIRGVTPALSARRRPLHRRLSESEKPTASPQRSPETRKQVSRLFRRCDLFDWTSSRICLRISANAAAMSQCAALTFCGSSSRTRPSRPRASAHSRASVCGSRGRGRGAGIDPGSPSPPASAASRGELAVRRPVRLWRAYCRRAGAFSAFVTI